MKRLNLAVLTMTAALAAAVASDFRTLEDLKNIDGFDKMMERGQIRAVFDPQFTPANKASLPDNAWVIGVAHEGVAKAYAINMMNRCEVVNDAWGDKPVLISWSPLAQAASAFSRTVNGKTLEFESSGALMHGAHVLQDTESDSFWSVVADEAVGGPMQGAKLARLPIVEKTTWSAWKARNPGTSVMTLSDISFISENPYDGYYKSPKTYKPVKKPDRRLDDKMPIFGFVHKGKPYAISFQGSAGGWKGKAGKDAVFFFRPPRSNLYQSTYAYVLGGANLKKKGDAWADKSKGAFDPIQGVFENGEALARIGGADMYWHVWSKTQGKAKILNPPRKKRKQFDAPKEMTTNADDLTKRN